jgi:hypothetical protein
MVLFYVNYSLLKMWHVVARQFAPQCLHCPTFYYPLDLLTLTMGFFRPYPTLQSSLTINSARMIRLLCSKTFNI